MLCQIDEEYLDEYICLKEQEIGNGVVEYLSDMRDYTNDTATRKLLCGYINRFSEKYKICRHCLCTLTPIVIKEPHTELDGCWSEEIVSGYRCENCGSKYEF